jgi:uncharacterized protein DUF2510/uncharacterized protein DUF2516
VIARVGIFGPFLVLGLIGPIISIWALIDAIGRPEWAWQASGQSKTLWVVLNVIGILLCGIVIGLIYLVGIRPKVAMAERGGGTGAGGMPYGGSGYGGSGYGGSGYGGTQGYGGSPGYGWTPPPSSAPPPPPPQAPPPSGVPAGWYPDPSGGGGLRYWNGSAWTEDVRPG